MIIKREEQVDQTALVLQLQVEPWLPDSSSAFGTRLEGVSASQLETVADVLPRTCRSSRLVSYNGDAFKALGRWL